MDINFTGTEEDGEYLCAKNVNIIELGNEEPQYTSTTDVNFSPCFNHTIPYLVWPCIPMKNIEQTMSRIFRKSPFSDMQQHKNDKFG